MTDGYYDHELNVCITTYSTLLVLIGLFIDFIYSIYCLILFIRPLRKHAKLMVSQGENIDKATKYHHLIAKYTLLASIALISSQITLALAALTGYGLYWAILDNVINGYCVLMLKNIHKNIYFRLCGVCHKCCIKCCGKVGIDFVPKMKMVYSKASRSDIETNTEEENQL